MSNIIKFDFQGSLYSFNADGWFNATDAAKRFDKEPFYWLNQRDTVDYIAALAKHIFNNDFVQELNKIKCLDSKSAKSRRLILNLVKRTGLVRTKSGPLENGGGTWMHPKLAVPFARWLNIDFAVWCDLQIDAIIRNGIRADGNQSLIPLLLRPDAAEWELRFPPEYYHALARVTGTKYTGHSGGTPALYGQITDRWVYGCLLPDDVHAELKTRKHESQKMHQWLTDGGQQLLDNQISQVIAIAKSSTDYKDFETRMMLLSGKNGQLGFVYPRAA